MLEKYVKETKKIAGMLNIIGSCQYMLDHSKQLPEFLIQTEATEGISRFISNAQTRGRYSPHVVGSFFAISNDKGNQGIYIDKQGAKYHLPEVLATELPERLKKYQSTLPIVDRQEVLPIFSMIKDSNISSEQIYRYLGGGEFPKIPEIFSSEEFKYFSGITTYGIMNLFPKAKASEYASRQICMIHDEMIESFKTGQPRQVLIFDGALEWALDPSFKTVMDLSVSRTYGLGVKINHNPTFEDKMALMGISYEIGKFEESLNLFDQLESSLDSEAQMLNVKAYMLMSLGELNEAKDVLTQASKFSNSNFFVHNNLGTILQIEGNYDAAIKEYKKEIDINPTHPTSQRSIDRIASVFS